MYLYSCPQKGGCTEHGSQTDFWCNECGQALCGHCLLDGNHVREGHDVVKAKVFVKERKKHMQTLASHLRQEIGKKKEDICINAMKLVARFSMNAQESDVLSRSWQKADAILKEASGVTDIESVLVSSALMESLHSEVKQMLSVNKEDFGDEGLIGSAAARLVCSSEDGLVDHNTREGRVRCKSCSGELEGNVEVNRQTSISEVEWVDETEQQQHPEVPDDRAAQQRQEVVTETTTRETNRENSRASLLLDVIMPAEQEEGDEAENIIRSDSSPQEEGDILGDQVDNSTISTQPVPSIQPKKPWPLQCCVVNPGGRTGRLTWENDRMHMYALSHHQNLEAHILVQVPSLSL